MGKAKENINKPKEKDYYIGKEKEREKWQL